jgi:hypothetical protein
VRQGHGPQAVLRCRRPLQGLGVLSHGLPLKLLLVRVLELVQQFVEQLVQQLVQLLVQQLIEVVFGFLERILELLEYLVVQLHQQLVGFHQFLTCGQRFDLNRPRHLASLG